MSAAHIFQIYYSERTRSELDPGFTPLDNMANERPDWREYWPMRNFLLRKRLADGEFYGFLSPRFGRKTSLASEQVKEFIQSIDPATDVVIFSPYVDQGAAFLNVFEHGESFHKGVFMQTAQDFVNRIGWDIDLQTLVMDGGNTVFCNYFAAKPRFWKAWLDACEKLFAIAEAADTDLGKRLNSSAAYGDAGAPLKVFLLERLASLLLAADGSWRSVAYDPWLLPRSSSPIASRTDELVALDALKHAHSTLGHPEYMEAYIHLRGAMMQAVISAAQAAAEGGGRQPGGS